MKTTACLALTKDMIIGKDVLDRQDRVLFEAGTKVDDTVIAKLKRYNIMCVDIMEDIDYATTHYEKVRCDDKFKVFEILYADSIRRYKTLMIALIEKNAPIDNNKLMAIYNGIRSAVPSNKALFDFLYNMVPSEEVMTYCHCLNSALIAGVFSEWLGLTEEFKNTLVLAGFYYDIGKLLLPDELLWKPGKLTEVEYLKLQSHTSKGFELVKNLELDESIKKAILQHHERMDGSGYPSKLTRNQIDIVAKYCAIIDAFEAMASPRVWRSSIPPLRIVENLENDRTKFDPEILVPLLKRIADAQIGTTVRLSDDSEWEVFIINSNKLSRPMLRNANNEVLDLSTRTDLQIEKII